MVHFMAAILPSSSRDRAFLLGHIHALIPMLQKSLRFKKVWDRLHLYPSLRELVTQSDRPKIDAAALQEVFIKGMYEMVWSGMPDDRCTIRQIRERMILLAVNLMVKKYQSMSIRARKEWRFEERAKWIREELAKHNPGYAKLCTDSVLHREIIRIVTAQLNEMGIHVRARRKKAPKEPETTINTTSTNVNAEGDCTKSTSTAS